MSEAGTRARLLAVGVVIVLLLAGTAWGDDDHFPFGPFRMYSTTNDLNGTVSSIKARATDEAGGRRALRSQDFGLRPPELDSNLGRFRRDPELISVLAEAYARLYPDRPSLAEVELFYEMHRLRDGRPIEVFEEEIVAWER